MGKKFNILSIWDLNPKIFNITYTFYILEGFLDNHLALFMKSKCKNNCLCFKGNTSHPGNRQVYCLA